MGAAAKPMSCVGTSGQKRGKQPRRARFVDMSAAACHSMGILRKSLSVRTSVPRLIPVRKFENSTNDNAYGGI